MDKPHIQELDATDLDGVVGGDSTRILPFDWSLDPDSRYPVAAPE